MINVVRGGGSHSSRFSLEREIPYIGTEFLDKMSPWEAFNNIVEKLSTVVFTEEIKTFFQKPVSISIKAKGLMVYGYFRKDISIGPEFIITYLCKAVQLCGNH